jgi:hypothetical protein
MATSDTHDTATDPTTPEIKWTTVSEEPEELTKVTLNLGDRFTAQFIGQRTMTGETGPYTQYRFLGGDGGRYFLNPGYQMREAFRRVRPSNLVRITMTDERDTGRETPMGVYVVEVAKLPANATLPEKVFEYGNWSATPPPF